jgi:hypothetical protein
MGRWKIECSLDGKEPEAKLYGEHADLSKRTFPNERYAKQVQDYLIIRAKGKRWDIEPPAYRTVLVDE